MPDLVETVHFTGDAIAHTVGERFYNTRNQFQMIQTFVRNEFMRRGVCFAEDSFALIPTRQILTFKTVANYSLAHLAIVAESMGISVERNPLSSKGQVSNIYFNFYPLGDCRTPITASDVFNHSFILYDGHRGARTLILPWGSLYQNRAAFGVHQVIAAFRIPFHNEKKPQSRGLQFYNGSQPRSLDKTRKGTISNCSQRRGKGLDYVERTRKQPSGFRRG